MGLVDVFVEHLLRLIIYSFKSVVHSVNVAGTGRWSCTEATVTTEPTVARGFGCPTVEVAYSYRVDGELYTGIYEHSWLIRSRSTSSASLMDGSSLYALKRMSLKSQ